MSNSVVIDLWDRDVFYCFGFLIGWLFCGVSVCWVCLNSLFGCVLGWCFVIWIYVLFVLDGLFVGLYFGVYMVIVWVYWCSLGLV